MHFTLGSEASENLNGDSSLSSNSSAYRGSVWPLTIALKKSKHRRLAARPAFNESKRGPRQKVANWKILSSMTILRTCQRAIVRRNRLEIQLL